MTKATRKRFVVLVEIVPLRFFALVGVVSPRLTYAADALVMSGAFRVHVGIPAEGFDFILTLVGVCLTPLLVFYCWRASRPLAEARGERVFATPPALYLGSFSTCFAPAWLPPLVDVYGRAAVVGGFVWWFASLLSFLAFIVAAAQVEAESIGESPGKLVLSTLYNLGGSIGVALARRAFPGCSACSEIARTPPAAALFLAAFVVLAVLQGML